MIIDLKDAKNSLTFYFTSDNKDKYFCSCGHHFEVDSVDSSQDLTYLNDEIDSGEEEFRDAIGITRISLMENLTCPSCETNYKLPVNQNKIRTINSYFIAGFKFLQEDDTLSLFYSKAKAIKNENKLEFEEIYKKITYIISTNKLYFYDYDNIQQEIDLDNLVKIIESFFKNDIKIINGMYDIHLFTIEIGKFVSDIENLNIKDGLMLDVKSKNSDTVYDAFKKILIIYFAIMKYSNLSTIVLTKNPLFLYDVIKESNPPKSEELKKLKITSPIDIFNYLGNNYIHNVNKEIEQDKINYQEFLLKNEEKEITLKIKNVNDYKTGKIRKNDNGNYEVLQLDGDGKISKFIYKKLKKFHDYKQLIKYMKHLEYKQLVELIDKYDYDLLVNMIDLIYYRDNISIEEIKRLIPLFLDFCIEKTHEMYENKDIDFICKNINYKFLSSFDFSFYDDCFMMLKTLEFDPKKDFYKIKTNSELKTFHDQVVKYYNAIKNTEDANYTEYFKRFKFLEDNIVAPYEGPLEIEILNTPTKVVQEGRDMHHSAASYVDRVMDGKYILLKVIDHSENLSEKELTRFTMGIFYNEKTGFEFEQVKSYSNQLASNRFRKVLMEWLVAKGINFDETKRPDLKIK